MNSVAIASGGGFAQAAAGLPVGSFLKWVKHEFQLAGIPVELGAPFTVLMPTLQTGSIRWEDGKIFYINAKHVSQAGIVPPEEGCQPHTSVLMVDGGGSICTFASSAWGGRNACAALIPQYVVTKETMLPIIALRSKERGNSYGTVDPLFEVVTWVPRAKFDAILGPAEVETAKPQLEAPKTKTPDPPVKLKIKGKLTEVLDDQIPF